MERFPEEVKLKIARYYHEMMMVYIRKDIYYQYKKDILLDSQYINIDKNILIN